MAKTRQLTAIIEREDDGFVALCPELDIASQGETVEDARSNLAEAIELFFEVADPSEIEQRMHNDVFVTSVEVAVGKTAGNVRPGGLRNTRRTRFSRGSSTRQPHRDAEEGT